MAEPVCDLAQFGAYIKATGLKEGHEEAWLDEHVIKAWTHRDYTKTSALSMLINGLDACKGNTNGN